MKKYITIFISTVLIICFLAYKLFFSNPLVSVILITYKNWELIIVNDGSTDNTSKVINEYTLKDARIKPFENDKNRKIVYSRNRGLANATGKYIAWIDDDDKAEPKKLERQVKFMEKNKDITILGTDISLINGHEKVYLGSVEYTPEESEIVFLIGGSDGLEQKVRDLSNFKFSMSKLTFLHQEALLILTEQIYRAFKILNNETYHK